MSIHSPSGIGSSILHEAKPSFVWSPYRAGRAAGNGAQGGGRVDVTIQNIDSTDPSQEFTVWHDGHERFEIKTETGNPEEVLGSVGDFSDGIVQNSWSTSWATANLGFGAIAPTTSGVLGQTSDLPDIIDGSHGNMTYVDTDEAQDSVIEKSNSRSASYTRVFQVLIKSEDGNSPATSGNVELGCNTAAGTRTTSSDTWYRQLPGSKGWWAVMYQMPAGAGTIYLSAKFKQGTGRWYIACPMWYSVFSTFENITRAPVPGGLSYRRGQYSVYTGSEFRLPISGWLGMSISLPDRSVSNGHLDYAGAGNYDFTGLMSWQSGNFRIRTTMSSSLDHLVVQMDESGVSFAFLDFKSDWNDFEKIGMVVTWGTSNGSNYAYLYVNGEKVDAVASAANWYPQNLAAAPIYIGSDGASGSAADCWISKVAIGRQPMARSFARTLSSYFRDTAKGARLGVM